VIETLVGFAISVSEPPNTVKNAYGGREHIQVTYIIQTRNRNSMLWGDLSVQRATRTLRRKPNHEVKLRAEKWAQQAHDGIQWLWNSRESLDQLNNPQLVGLVTSREKNVNTGQRAIIRKA